MVEAVPMLLLELNNTKRQLIDVDDALKFMSVLRGILLVKISRAPWSDVVTVKVRDFCRFIECDRGLETRIGWFLNELVREGLMWVSNKHSPKRYIAGEELLTWAKICRFPQCESGSLCGLYGLCPYFRLGLLEG